MIKELPPGPESEAEIAHTANEYARKVTDNPDWLKELSREQATDVLLMIFAHAEEVQLEGALQNIFEFQDEQEVK